MPKFINEAQVESVLTWPIIIQAVEQSLLAICQSNENVNEDLPYAYQPARIFTQQNDRNKACLLTMPGFIGNLQLVGKTTKCNTLGCKLVTMANSNEKLIPPLPNIMANILLFDDITGKLKCVMEATEITAKRTAAASIVATKYLYFQRQESSQQPILAIIGCGVQGVSHSFGMCHTFNFSEIRLYNRTASKAEELLKKLENSKKNFINSKILIKICHTIDEALLGADVVVTATFTTEPILQLKHLKQNVHINAVGAGAGNHHSELSQDIYSNSSVYIDNWASAKQELATLKANIIGELGEVIKDPTKPLQSNKTIFQSMGMAIEDAAVAQAVLNALDDDDNNKCN